MRRSRSLGLQAAALTDHLRDNGYEAATSEAPIPAFKASTLSHTAVAGPRHELIWKRLLAHVMWLGSANRIGSIRVRGGKSVVVRVFRVRVHPGKEDEFERFVIETGIPMVKSQEGCMHVTAGKAVIEPEEEPMLAEVFCDH